MKTLAIFHIQTSKPKINSQKLSQLQIPKGATLKIYIFKYRLALNKYCCYTPVLSAASYLLRFQKLMNLEIHVRLLCLDNLMSAFIEDHRNYRKFLIFRTITKCTLRCFCDAFVIPKVRYLFFEFLFRSFYEKYMVFRNSLSKNKLLTPLTL